MNCPGLVEAQAHDGAWWAETLFCRCNGKHVSVISSPMHQSISRNGNHVLISQFVHCAPYVIIDLLPSSPAQPFQGCRCSADHHLPAPEASHSSTGEGRRVSSTSSLQSFRVLTPWTSLLQHCSSSHAHDVNSHKTASSHHAHDVNSLKRRVHIMSMM